MSTIRIISWNVNGIRANAKKGGFDWLINESPDIFCLQETKAEAEQLDPGVRNPPGYHSYFEHSKGRKGYSGVAVYSKVKPKKEVEIGLGQKAYDQEGRFLALFYEEGDFYPGSPAFVLLNVYFPNGGGGPERLKFKLEYYDQFLKFVNDLKQKGHNILFCGDINTAHTAIDLARPKENEKNTGFLPIERAWLDKVVESGYTDVFRAKNPDAKEKYTYWDMKTFARERNVGWRIDYFFASAAIYERVEKIRILDQILGSDHCPLEIVIK